MKQEVMVFQKPEDGHWSDDVKDHLEEADSRHSALRLAEGQRRPLLDRQEFDTMTRTTGAIERL